MISRITTLQDSDVQFSTITTIQSIKKKMWPIKREKKNLTENEKVVMMKIKSKDICAPQVDKASLKV